jgi:hypothetical protein
LRHIRSICSEPWVIVGDFNLIYKAEDKNNDNINRSMMGRFRKFINDVGLIGTPLIGRKYTWSNHQTSPTLVRLDRVLCTVDWDGLFPNHLLQSAASEDSDHCPLILGLNSMCSGKRQFHFESFWPKLEGFQDVVLEAWNSVSERSCPFLTFDLKLKSTAKALQGWSAKKVGHVSSQLALAREILHQLEIAQDSRLLSPLEVWLLIGLKKHSLALASLKRTIARLRSRISWIKEGDANSKLFHMHARHRQRKNFVAKIVSGVNTFTDHGEKARVVDEFYFKLLGCKADRSLTVDLDYLGLPFHDLSDLDAQIDENEVLESIMQLPSDKAPGPDGYTGRF